MNITFDHPGDLRTIFTHVTDDGRTMVYLDADGTHRAGLFWLSPQQAAQWIEALTPLAAKAVQ